MGLIQVVMRAVPEGVCPKQYAEDVEKRARETNVGKYESCDCDVLKPEDFDEQWKLQDNLNDTDAMYAKYRQLTQEGRVVVLEIDW